MGNCLESDMQRQMSPQQQSREAWMEEQNDDIFRFRSRTPAAVHNDAHVKFETPKVPVVFVLGGPGSGKVTHCDNLMQERRGFTHINMTDLLQQYAIGNDMKDFSHLSSKTVTEVLMLEMKMAPAAKTYLVSGYPRSMRDVVEYSEKIKVVNGVVLVSWRQKVLERQIEYGAKLGHVVLSLARMELNNFYKNVMPVADYFDQQGLLYAVNGEREPSEVYTDFRTAVLKMLSKSVGHQNGAVPAVPSKALLMPFDKTPAMAPAKQMDEVFDEPVYKPPTKGVPQVIWVIGGPGSNKGALCVKAVRQAPGWVHCSVGQLLRAAAETPSNDSVLLRQCISSGDLVPQTYVLQLVESQINTHMNAQGIIMDGFPRNMTQVHEFESKFNQQPEMILLDCSKLQLGRGRLDDSVAAFRRRLEVFREMTLPMLKTLDNESRLTIVDGDTDTQPVVDEFIKVILGHIEGVKRNGGMIVPKPPLPNPPPPPGTIIHDIELEQENGPSSVMVNGVRPSRDTIRDMYANVENYPMDSRLG